jgi:hypothetical protein
LLILSVVVDVVVAGADDAVCFAELHAVAHAITVTTSMQERVRT